MRGYFVGIEDICVSGFVDPAASWAEAIRSREAVIKNKIGNQWQRNNG